MASQLSAFAEAIRQRLQERDDVFDVLRAHGGRIAGVAIKWGLHIQIGDIGRGQIIEFQNAAIRRA